MKKSKAMRRILREKAVFLMATALLMCVALAAQAQVRVCGDYQYILGADQTAQITEYTGKDTQIIIPGKLDGYTVSAVGDRAFRRCKASGIEIPKSVTTLGDEAFGSCGMLREIVIPEGVTTLGDQAFGSCMGLFEVVLPKSVTAIGENAFLACWQVTLVVEADSFVLTYAQENKMSYTYAK